MKPAVRTPVSIATACLAGAVLVPAVPAGAVLRAAPVGAERPLFPAGRLVICQATTNTSDTDSAWNFDIRPKGIRKVVAGGLLPGGTQEFPGCRTISLPAGSYRVAETQKAGLPVVRVVVEGPGGKTRTVTAGKGRKLTAAGFGIAGSKITKVTFYNKVA